MTGHNASGGARRPFWAGVPARKIRRGHFWVAGERVEREGKTFQRGPMFAEWEAPPGNLIYEKNSDAALAPVLAWLERHAGGAAP